MSTARLAPPQPASGHLARILREARGARHDRPSIRDLARAIGCDHGQLSRVFRGAATMNEEKLVRLALELGIAPASALLAAGLDRVPAELQPCVSPQDLPLDAGGDFQAARRLQRRQLDFEAERLHTVATIDRSGGVEAVRHYHGLRPLPGCRTRHFEIRERAVGSGWPPDFGSGVSIIPTGGDVRMMVSTEPDGEYRVHRIAPATGLAWPLQGVSLAHVSYGPHAYRFTADRNDGAFQQVLLHAVNELVITLSFPLGYAPASWLFHAWMGSSPWTPCTPNHLERGICRRFKFSHEASRAEVVLSEPLAGFSYAIRWRPAPEWKPTSAGEVEA